MTSTKRSPSKTRATRKVQALTDPAKAPVLWHQPDRAPFRLSGFAWYAQERMYRRLPRKPADALPKAVDDLANNTAGGQASFTTNSRILKLDAELAGTVTMDHMAPTGSRGFDVYVGLPRRQRFLAVTRFAVKDKACEVVLFQSKQARWRTFTINFPLYQGVRKLRIGLEASALIKAPPPFASRRPIVIYGTSITQGGCAARPGMVFTNILGRRLNAEVINLGFSGSGQAELEVARTIATIPDPALLIMDCDANCSDDILKNRLPEFIAILRAAHPKTPILVVSRIRFAACWVDPHAERLRKKRMNFQRHLVERRQKQGDRHIHFLDGGSILGKDGDECTVDGVHATDLGFFRMAEGMEPVIRRLVLR